MKEIIGTSNRGIEINLSTKQVKEFEISNEDRKMYLGGKGLALKYLYEKLEPGINSFNEKNIIAFFMGVYMGTGAPNSGRFAGVTKSPLTGLIVSSSCGGPFGMAFKTAGYDALIITGRSEKPVFIEIHPKNIRIKDASHVWGKDTIETQDALCSEKKSAALVIGPAGENKVLYSNIASGQRFFGRGGMGAVMGSKNLKAIVAYGNEYKIVPKNLNIFKKLKTKATKQINKNNFTANLYRNFGTCTNVNFCNRGGILPVSNFRFGNHKKAYLVSGELMKEKYNTKHSSCVPCTILCGHKGTYKDGVHQIPEYETTALFGPNLEIFDTDIISSWNNICNRMGMDTISTAVTLSYIMEAGEKKLINTKLKFGSPENIKETLEDIAFRRGSGNDYANGTRWLSEKYGGKDFAIHVKGLEMAAYDPRGSWGQGLSYAVANRGACHISASIFSSEVFMGFLNPYTHRAKAKFVRFFENLFSTINSLHTCLFTSFAYILEPPVVKYTPQPLLSFAMQNLPDIAIMLMDISIYSKLFEAICGIKMSQKNMIKIGERIHTLERYMNTREGISKKDDTLPDRFLKESRKYESKNKRIPLNKMLKKYYKIRGYDNNGIPKKETLQKLSILN